MVLKINKDGWLLKGTIDIGWRVPCTDGFIDVMWGNTKNDESLRLLLAEIEREYGKKEIIDERAS